MFLRCHGNVNPHPHNCQIQLLGGKTPIALMNSIKACHCHIYLMKSNHSWRKLKGPNTQNRYTFPNITTFTISTQNVILVWITTSQGNWNHIYTAKNTVHKITLSFIFCLNLVIFLLGYFTHISKPAFSTWPLWRMNEIQARPKMINHKNE